VSHCSIRQSSVVCRRLVSGQHSDQLLHTGIFSTLYIPTQLIESLDGRTSLLLTNFGSYDVTLERHQKLTKASPVFQIFDSIPSRSDDVRLRPEYVMYAQKRLNFDKSVFIEAFRNNHDFHTDDWSNTAINFCIPAFVSAFVLFHFCGSTLVLFFCTVFNCFVVTTCFSS
jgi:hypothetical protein